MTKTPDPLDPKGLVREAYNMEGITAAECRSIFLDWALSLPETLDQPRALVTLHERYREERPDHPMTEVLRQGLSSSGTPRRRGGWRSRSRN